jgi:hypothetical protein
VRDVVPLQSLARRSHRCIMQGIETGCHTLRLCSRCAGMHPASGTPWVRAPKVWHPAAAKA